MEVPLLEDEAALTRLRQSSTHHGTTIVRCPNQTRAKITVYFHFKIFKNKYLKYFDWFKINLKDFHWLDVNYFYFKTFEKHPEGGSGSIITLLHIHPPVTTATAEGDRLASAPASGVDKQANAAPKTRNNVVKIYSWAHGCCGR